MCTRFIPWWWWSSQRARPTVRVDRRLYIVLHQHIVRVCVRVCVLSYGSLKRDVHHSCISPEGTSNPGFCSLCCVCVDGCGIRLIHPLKSCHSRVIGHTAAVLLSYIHIYGWTTTMYNTVTNRAVALFHHVKVSAVCVFFSVCCLFWIFQKHNLSLLLCVWASFLLLSENLTGQELQAATHQTDRQIDRETGSCGRL